MSFHAQNQAKLSSWKFIEMWVDPSSDLPYVLMLVGDVDGSYTLYDPTEGYQVVYVILQQKIFHLLIVSRRINHLIPLSWVIKRIASIHITN